MIHKLLSLLGIWKESILLRANAILQLLSGACAVIMRVVIEVTEYVRLGALFHLRAYILQARQQHQWSLGLTYNACICLLYVRSTEC